jgi:transposase
MGERKSINKRLSLEETPDSYIFYLGEEAHIKVKKEEPLSLKVAIVALASGGLAKQGELAKVFGMRRQTIWNYLKAYRKYGVSGLANHRSGSHGIPDEIEKRVVELLLRATQRVEIPKIIAQEFGKSISRAKVYEIRKKHLSDLTKEPTEAKGGKN